MKRTPGTSKTSQNDRIAVVTDEVSRDFSAALGIAVEHGVTAVEIRGAFGKRVPDFNATQIQSMRSAIANTGIRVLGISPGIGKGDIPTDLRDKMSRSIAVAHELGAPSVTFFGFSGSGESPADIRRSTDALREIAVTCEEQHVVACLENIGTGCTAGRLDVTFQIARNAGVRVIWDPANACAAGDPVSIRLKPEYLALVERIHVKGYASNQPPVDPDTGDFDWEQHITSVESGGYAGSYTIEPHQWDDQPDSFLRSLRCLKRWLSGERDI